MPNMPSRQGSAEQETSLLFPFANTNNFSSTIYFVAAVTQGHLFS